VTRYAQDGESIRLLEHRSCDGTPGPLADERNSKGEVG
jgi:hypothetical protein